jgi:hypothetical protein
MNRFRANASARHPWMTAPILITAFLASSGVARAEVVLNNGSHGYSNFQLDTTVPTGSGSGPIFSGGELFSPGSGFPLLDEGVEGVSQMSNQTPISTNFISSYTNLAAGYGTGTTDMLATLLGGNGASSARGGIFWLNDTTLADGLAPGTTGYASVSVSIATAMFTNTSTTTSVNIQNPGALLSVSGTLGSDTSSYVAAGLTSSFTLSGPGVTSSTTNLGNIALAANRNGASIAYNGGGGGGTSASLSNGFLSATASATNPGGSITLLPNESITFSATLTLISDPGSTLSISSTMDPGFPTDPADMPTFGIFAGGPNVVPEPSTIVLLGVGLSAAGLWARRTRRAGSATA